MAGVGELFARIIDLTRQGKLVWRGTGGRMTCVYNGWYYVVPPPPARMMLGQQGGELVPIGPTSLTDRLRNEITAMHETQIVQVALESLCDQ